MSGRFVRASKFRHVNGEPGTKDGCFSELRPDCTGEGNYVKANNLYFALPYTGGGGPMLVHPINQPQRFGANPPLVNVHKARVLDMEFNPFYSDLIASCSEDCTIKMVKIPQGGLTETISQELVNLSGHEKRVSLIHFSPTADNILASCAYDNTLKVWDVEAQCEILNNTSHPDFIQSFEWNRNGSMIASTCKDKYIRVYDPRTGGEGTRIEGHQGGKSSRIVWMENHNLLASCGFNKNSVRKVSLYDTRNLGDPISEIELDQSAGVLVPYYDEDTSILFIAGKGDGNIRYYEIVDEAPFIHYLADFRSNTPHKGVGFAPKTACDYMKCEIDLCFRVLRDIVEPVHFIVPRKSDLFQADLFPDTYAGVASLTAVDWKSGKNKDPKMSPLQEAAAAGQKATATTFKAKKSPAELEKELDEAYARIAELEALVAKLKQ